MLTSTLKIEQTSEKIELCFSGELNIYKIAQYLEQIDRLNFNVKSVVIDLKNVTAFDTSAALFIQGIQNKTSSSTLYITDKKIEKNLELVKNQATTAIVDNEKKRKFS